jgi:sterol carrier protein 2
MSRAALVAGVGLIPFTRPAAGESYAVIGARAGHLALRDAGVEYRKIRQIYAGYVYGESCCGQAVAYEIGLSGVPVINVNNQGATGATALFLARQAVASGAVDCALALGFEQVSQDAQATAFPGRLRPLQRLLDLMSGIQGLGADSPCDTQLFGGGGRMHMQMYGTRAETFGRILVKARRHAVNNPYAVFREPLTLERVMNSPVIFEPLTRQQCCEPACGAAAAVVCSEAFAVRWGLKRRVKILAQALTTDTNSSFDEGDMRKLAGYDMSRNAARQVYEQAGIGPDEIDVCELHDCCTANEVLSYEALGLTPEGTAERFILDGDNTYGGSVVTNPSGGLLSMGHPLGATGLAQCAELIWQLRGEAGARQVEGARTALQHNIGLGGACVVTLYQSA